ncbi:50S ribosomal protein L13 [Candidatus Woesearchaeota archaeon]|nr:50S ribosomal protein L13 [Candidatus Woesearchaeota archaeon]
MIIDATDLVAGRLAAVAAKQALLGNKVDIINCENAVISGKRNHIIADYHHNITTRGTPGHGPFISRMPDRFLRRIIRGMLPHKDNKGINAFKRIMCYIGTPKEFEGKKTETVKNADIKERQLVKFIRLSELCKHLGAIQ